MTLTRFQDLTLRRKLVLITFIASGVALLLAGAGFVLNDFLSAREGALRAVRIRARIISDACSPGLALKVTSLLDDQFRALEGDTHILSATVFKREGSVFSEYVARGHEAVFQRPASEGEGARWLADRLVLHYPIVTQRGVIGVVAIQRETSDLKERFHRNTAAVSGLVLIALVVAFLLAARLERLVSGPILHLARTANLVAERKDYSIRAERFGQDETGHLAERFNEMLGQIQARDGELQRVRASLEQRVVERTAELSSANTQLKQQIAERELAQQEQQKFVALVENSQDFIGMATMDGRVLYVNHAGRTLVGLDNGEGAAGRNVEEFHTPESLVKHREVILPALVTAGSWEGESQFRHFKTGRTIVLHRSIFVVRHPATGEPFCVATVSRDITERKRHERRDAVLAALGQKLSTTSTPKEAGRTILESAQELIGWDAGSIDLIAIEANLSREILNCDTIGGRRVEVASASNGGDLTPFQRRVMTEGARMILRDKPAFEPGALAPFGDRSRPSASLLFVPIRHGLRKVGVLTIQSYTRDAYRDEDLATLQSLADLCGGALERIQTEAALRQSEERFARAFRASPVSIGISTLTEGRFIDVNDTFLRLFKFRRDDVIGHTSTELKLWVKPEERTRLVAELRARRSVRDFECQFRTRTGEPRDTLVFVELIELGSEPCLLFLTHDITERLSLETQLRHSQKMDAIGQLAAGVAHDFNNILTIIQGHVSLLLLNQELPPKMAASLSEVNLASERAANLTRQLLTFSRKQVLQPRYLDLSKVVLNATNMLHRLLGEDVSLQVNCAPQLPHIHADTGMMEQVLINLAVNSRDAMPRGGRLEIATELVDVDAAHATQNPEARTGLFACLRATDTGCGMSATTLSRIFEPFFTTKEVGKGTGLGLATVYGIVKQHAGWIEVRSELGKGTTFCIFLPISPKPPGTTSDTAVFEATRGGTETILFVEDEPALRDMVRSILQLFGYTVIAATHGGDALTLWRQHGAHIHLLLTDMVMPEGMSGFDLAAELRQDNPGLRVVFTSGYSVDLFDSRQELKEGLNFIAKPYQPNALARTVRACLDAR